MSTPSISNPIFVSPIPSPSTVPTRTELALPDHRRSIDPLAQAFSFDKGQQVNNMASAPVLRAPEIPVNPVRVEQMMIQINAVLGREVTVNDVLARAEQTLSQIAILVKGEVTANDVLNIAGETQLILDAGLDAGIFNATTQSKVMHSLQDTASQVEKAMTPGITRKSNEFMQSLLMLRDALQEMSNAARLEGTMMTAVKVEAVYVKANATELEGITAVSVAVAGSLSSVAMTASGAALQMTGKKLESKGIDAREDANYLSASAAAGDNRIAQARANGEVIDESDHAPIIAQRLQAADRNIEADRRKLEGSEKSNQGLAIGTLANPLLQTINGIGTADQKDKQKTQALAAMNSEIAEETKKNLDADGQSSRDVLKQVLDLLRTYKSQQTSTMDAIARNV